MIDFETQKNLLTASKSDLLSALLKINAVEEVLNNNGMVQEATELENISSQLIKWIEKERN